MTRAAVVVEARSWLGTPWQRQARVKGVGVDCLQLLIGVYSAVGLIPALETPPGYVSGWDVRDMRYFDALAPYLEDLHVGPPQPGDLAIFRIGQYPSHAGIVTKWPCIVHADGLRAERVIETRVDQTALANRVVCVRTPKGLA